MATTSSPTAIRLSISPEVRRALRLAKMRYPTLSSPEILKLGLSKIIEETISAKALERSHEIAEIRGAAAYSVGYDYLNDTEEDVYTEDMGKKVSFS